MKKSLCMILVLVVCLSSQLTAFADEPTEVLPSGKMYSNIEATVDAYVADHQATIAAVSVAVFVHDQVLLEKSYGYRRWLGCQDELVGAVSFGYPAENGSKERASVHADALS